MKAGEGRAPFDVLVIGAGAQGLASALACQQAGRKVALADPGEARRRASYGNAGVVSPGSILPLSGPQIWKKLPSYLLNRDAALRLDHANLWRVAPWGRRFLASANARSVRRAAAALAPLAGRAFAAHVRLAGAAGVPELLSQKGWIKLYRSEAAFEGAEFERDLLGAHGIRTEILDGAALAELEPALQRRYGKAMWLPDAGAVADPGALLAAYERLFLERGGAWPRTKVEALEREGAAWIARWSGGEARAKAVVIAVGAWSGGVTGRLGYRFPMAAERGYHQQFSYGEGPKLQRPVYDTGGAFIISPMRQGLRVLSGVELAPRDAAPDLTQILAVVRQAQGTVRLGAPIENEPWLGARPSSPDGLPVIGAAPRHPGIVFAFGHGHIGLSTAPVTGEIVAALVAHREPPIDIRPFSPARFV